MANTSALPHRIIQAAEIASVRLSRLVAEGRVRGPEEISEPDLTVGFSARSVGRGPSPGFWVVVRAEAVVKDKHVPASESAIRIVADVEVKYDFPKELDAPTDVELQSFANSNGVLNAWPYLRETIQNASVRMGFPPILLPLYRIARAPATPQRVEAPASRRTKKRAVKPK